MTHVSFDAVSCNRGGRTLFSDMTFSLEAGDALRLTGANGVGKSSLLRMAAGLLEPVAGHIQSEGVIALADEKLALDPARALIDSLQFWALVDGGDAMAALASVGMDHLARVPVRMLSTGQRRRATIARIIASRADIWLLDEPANGLDNDGLAILEGLIAAHRVQGGIVMVATHQPIALDSPQERILG